MDFRAPGYGEQMTTPKPAGGYAEKITTPAPKPAGGYAEKITTIPPKPAGGYAEKITTPQPKPAGGYAAQAETTKQRFAVLTFSTPKAGGNGAPTPAAPAPSAGGGGAGVTPAPAVPAGGASAGVKPAPSGDLADHGGTNYSQICLLSILEKPCYYIQYIQYSTATRSKSPPWGREVGD